MAAQFVSGRLKIAVTYSDRTGGYKIKLCPTERGERCETVSVNNPGGGVRSAHGRRIAVDDPRALHQAARAAISFASGDMQEHADYNRSGSGWLVRPLRRKRKAR